MSSGVYFLDGRRTVDAHLPGSIEADELFVDLPGFGRLLGGLGLLVVLAGQVEGDVLLAELRDQECSEEAESIWGQQPGVRSASRGLKTLRGTLTRTYFGWTAVYRRTPSRSKVLCSSTCQMWESQSGDVLRP